MPSSKIHFFTLKSYRNNYSMDKVRKWLARFAKMYIIVQSPQGGIHYHGLYVPHKTPGQLNRGTKFTQHPLGDSKEELLVERLTPGALPRVKHPVVGGEKGMKLMNLCAAIRQQGTMILYRWNHIDDTQRDSLREVKSVVKRVEGRRSRRRVNVKRNFHVRSCEDYLLKNYHENSDPIYRDHLFIKM